MFYINIKGERVAVQDEYYVDITSDITTTGKKAVKGFHAGWFTKNVSFPTAIFYLLSSPITDYFAGKPYAERFTYYFEVRAYTPNERDDIAKSLCSQLSTIYNARRSQYNDSFEADTYIKRITFTFTVKLGE